MLIHNVRSPKQIFDFVGPNCRRRKRKTSFHTTNFS